MPRPKSRKPQYTLHKATNRAYVRLNGRCVYLGTFGCQESRDKYDRLIGEWITRGRQPEPPAAGTPSDPTGAPPASLKVVELIDRYWTASEEYYVNPDGSESSELHVLKQALRLLKRLYGDTVAAEFGPKQLKALRQAMIDGEPPKEPSDRGAQPAR